ALLQLAHLFCQGRLVTYGGGHTAEQCRYLGTCQGVTVDVVDEQQYVTAFVTEFLGHGQAGQGHAQTVAGRLVHLAVHHRYFRVPEVLGVDYLRFLHLVVEVVTFTGTLTNTCEYGETTTRGSDVVDQLHHVYGLAYAGTTEQTYLAALGEGADQVDNLDTGFQQFGGSGLLGEGRSLAVDRHALFLADGATLVDRVAQYVHDAAEGFFTHRYGY